MATEFDLAGTDRLPAAAAIRLEPDPANEYVECGMAATSAAVASVSVQWIRGIVRSISPAERSSARLKGVPTHVGSALTKGRTRFSATSRKADDPYCEPRRQRDYFGRVAGGDARPRPPRDAG